jgi:hypothetical protein
MKLGYQLKFFQGDLPGDTFANYRLTLNDTQLWRQRASARRLTCNYPVDALKISCANVCVAGRDRTSKSNVEICYFLPHVQSLKAGRRHVNSHRMKAHVLLDLRQNGH